MTGTEEIVCTASQLSTFARMSKSGRMKNWYLTRDYSIGNSSAALIRSTQNVASSPSMWTDPVVPYMIPIVVP